MNIFFYKCSNSGRNESTPQTQSNVSWISSKAGLEISFMKTRLEMWVWESVPRPWVVEKLIPLPALHTGGGVRGCTDIDHIGSTFGEPLTSTYVWHLQVFSIDIDIFWSQSLIFCTFPRENAWKMSLFVGVCVCACVYIYIYQHIILHFFNIWFWFFGAFSPW